MTATLWSGLLVAFAGFYLATLLSGRKKNHPPLPPGPPRKPIIGNLWDLPTPDQQDWQHWLKHKELYGPISSLSVMGKTIIILNDARLAVDLMEKRSAINSSRPEQTFTELTGWDEILGCVKDPERHRQTRKQMHREIGSNNSVARFNQIQTAEAGRFLLRVLDAPDDLLHHIRKQAGAVILSIGYGYTVEPHGQDPLVELADRAMTEFSIALLPATWLVDFLPILRYVPAWFPGAGFVKTAQGYKKNVTDFTDIPYGFVKQQMRSGSFVPSLLSNLLQDNPVPSGSEDENTVKWSVGSLYAGGADTTVSTMSSFFLAMALFPEVQRRAKQEIDSVVGSDRLPQFQDRDNLPYINAVVKEALRWHSVVPMGVAHSSTQDDTFEGYFIPKGSSILSNIWAYTHDPSIYPDPTAFKPERFLASDGHPPERDPHLLVFGFGRRVCPGRTLADANVYLTIAQVLAVFEISKPVEDGKAVDLVPKFIPGVISHPAPYRVSVQPRSEAHRELIRSVEQEYPWEKSHAGELAKVALPQTPVA
ncbi:cytochrome P450 oxidoreductase OrdA-like protein [Aspergillus heteromorphus CBS 117.55]|uniref:Cytochrome P450 oxidoreductase OrdA-like protein n=1 Tax=Aspergillus heteromorphus CBS 117.55 TaxID=1448321 RepID=A0A317WI84_9EURO|nr:cytochrome P450 oxidoreductase OrdA-like protein [Aspergillus heteromorphus CBS 117.55]PWY84768.1 cytochrome P450 oxidoreductase OrdA-like protein [Aspergillus heteromorphus CBS 117.55]